MTALVDEARLLWACVAAVVAAAITLIVLSRAAAAMGLLDRPGGRKRHHGAIPLVGGLSILIGVLIGAAVLGHLSNFEYWLLATATVLTIVGALDDRYTLRVRDRVLIQAVLIVAMMLLTGVHVDQLGSLYGFDARLGWAGLPFTLLALIGLLNAFNLIDGIDGLASMLALVAIAGILSTVNGSARSAMGPLLLVLTIAIVPQLASNLGLFGAHRRSFLGDAGSTLLGYIVGWALIYHSQQPELGLSPVGALWCVAIPVFDTLSVIVRRLYNGVSPFKPGRRHIHYMLMDAGLGPRRTLAALVCAAVAIWCVGDGVRALNLGSGTNLTAFSVMLIAYILATTQLERWLRTHSRSKVLGVVQLPAEASGAHGASAPRDSLPK